MSEVLPTYRSARLLAISVCLLASSLLASCQTTATSLGKSLFSEAPPSPSARIIAALDGGLVGKTTAELSDNDLKRAMEAEYRTLEAAPSGRPIIWRGDDANGEVTAAAPFQVGTQNCRQYSHTVIAGGKQMQARGSACRADDGSWSLLD